LKIVGVLPAVFHLVSIWIWREKDRKIPVIFRAISGDFRPFHQNVPENALDPAVSDRTYLTWDVLKIENLLICTKK
jgi:hypothetical protein